jgi:hypothetical protein
MRVSISSYSVALEADGTTILASDTMGLPATGTFVQLGCESCHTRAVARDLIHGSGGPHADVGHKQN